MGKKIDTFGQIKVRHPAGRADALPLTLTFVDPDVMAAVENKLRGRGFVIVDSSPGYKLYRDLDDALHSVDVFCRAECPIREDHHVAPEPPEEPPFCDRCFGNHSHTGACPEDFADEDEDDGEPRCTDPRGHKWTVSDEDENYCYCERCGCCEY